MLDLAEIVRNLDEKATKTKDGFETRDDIFLRSNEDGIIFESLKTPEKVTSYIDLESGTPVLRGDYKTNSQILQSRRVRVRDPWSKQIKSKIEDQREPNLYDYDTTLEEISIDYEVVYFEGFADDIMQFLQDKHKPFF